MAFSRRVFCCKRQVKSLSKGSTTILILSVLSDGGKHGYAFMRELEARSQMICIQAGLVLISRWKASPGVLIHWLSSIVLILTGLLLSEASWPWLPVDVKAMNTVSLPEMGFWFAALALLLAWLVRVVYQQRGEPPLVDLAVTPFLFAAANYAAVLTRVYHHMDPAAYVFPRLGWFGLYQVASFLWPALFFLPHQRDLRWAGLMLLPVTYLLYHLWPYHSYPLVVTLYLLPACLVLITWARDVRARLVPKTHFRTPPDPFQKPMAYYSQSQMPRCLGYP